MLTRLRCILGFMWVVAMMGCGGGHITTAPTPARPASANDAVVVEPVAQGIWLHRSVKYLPEYGDVPSNGLIIQAGEEALVVDTAWTPEQTAQVLDWAEQHVGPVRAVLVTHWHDDRSGGLPEVHRRGITSYGSKLTVQQARAHNAPVPSRQFENTLDLSTLGVAGEAHFAGAGHSLDNLVVWFAESKLLFGGCLVKAANAQSLGNVTDGDLDAWPHTLTEVQIRYPNAATVVPGHGAPGGLDLLTHTQELVSR